VDLVCIRPSTMAGDGGASSGERSAWKAASIVFRIAMFRIAGVSDHDSDLDAVHVSGGWQP
jgi:hypothetical protein